MSRARRTAGLHRFDEALLVAKPGKVAPHEFVLDAISSLSPVTRPMFGCLAVYVEDKIVLILRDKPNSKADNGVWLATTAELILEGDPRIGKVPKGRSSSRSREREHKARAAARKSVRSRD